MSSLFLRAGTSRSLSSSLLRSNTLTRSLLPATTTLSVASTPTITTLINHLPTKSTKVHFFSTDDGSSSSHNDFAPQRKAVVDDEDEALKLIKDHVEANHVMLYMKGNPSQPMCGFSARVVQVLQNEGVDFSSVNVLDYPAIREGIKKFSDWPTIPQLYVDGEFVGGCDIVTSMHENGELAEVLKKE
mmetsp:Transcript_54078/g.65288  ORF Transcript_54078/g.65288 Transcript_54078/m.65288 type:complete len:187 (-) Transcript_54078:222-782(-)|eukprot:CAMPEP_0172498440 /NCGR_PEP_ID=MMETSP1066-20121228/113434_1 /TAXON_ID=671091 /ORGANISM="Coscinodiscus wailesii, Strain CCMP2513" /LENGTH=186 /DNA_ID=CAMNT_0013271717 /DNA_START=55 /DNA_END=615 /DNA_ORIENTATION=+